MQLSKYALYARQIGIFLCLVMISFSSCTSKKVDFQSDHFTIETLAVGVYAAIHKPGGEAICNAGIIDLGEETLIFDCFMTPKAAADLKTAAELITGNPVRYVVNSHYHNDHIRGNQVFDEQTSIISTKLIRDLIEKHEPEEIQSEKEYAPGWLAELEEEYKISNDTNRKKELIMWLGYVKGMLDSHSSLTTVLPDSTFSGELIIEGSRRKVKLSEFLNAHTENDIVLHILDEKIMFAGDLLFVNCHPYLAHGDPYNLIEVLNELKRMEPGIIVPGHGPLGNAAHLDELIGYINEVNQVSERYVAENKTTDDISDEDIPEAFSHWQFSNFFKYNLGYMIAANAEEPQEF